MRCGPATERSEGSRAKARHAISRLTFCEEKSASHIAENGYKYLEMADIS